MAAAEVEEVGGLGVGEATRSMSSCPDGVRIWRGFRASFTLTERIGGWGVQVERLWRAGAAVFTAALLAACGNGAIEASADGAGDSSVASPSEEGSAEPQESSDPADGNDADQDDADQDDADQDDVGPDEDTDGSGSEEKKKPDKPKYGFGLPRGDTSVEIPAGVVYEAIQSGNCDMAQRTLEAYVRDGAREEVAALFATAVALCRGDVAAAKKSFRFERADSEEDNGGNWFLCETYRAAASVIRQEPRENFGTCPPVKPLNTSDSDGDGVLDREDADAFDPAVTDISGPDFDGDGVRNFDDPDPFDPDNPGREPEPEETESPSAGPSTAPTGDPNRSPSDAPSTAATAVPTATGAPA